jgi:hypothetical protein
MLNRYVQRLAGLAVVISYTGAYLVEPTTNAAADTASDCSSWQVVDGTENCDDLAASWLITATAFSDYVSHYSIIVVTCTDVFRTHLWGQVASLLQATLTASSEIGALLRKRLQARHHQHLQAQHQQHQATVLPLPVLYRWEWSTTATSSTSSSRTIPVTISLPNPPSRWISCTCGILPSVMNARLFGQQITFASV